MTKKLGFTGTRHGMTDGQRASFGSLIVFDLLPTEFHHGSCQGADVEAARLVEHVTDGGSIPCRIVCHPGPDGDPHQQQSGVDDETLPGKTHFARNRDIVDGTDALVAAPAQMEGQQFGGTWYTIRYARKTGKPLWIVWPDGTVTAEGR